ncbi:zinc finger BED domain-containing protein 1 [Trichonephila inaurata madagascariensis]|uniref:Zinc finger BED domain-containing protein 1 n=1 Tax=Trichonephila inaurata madagascariensis TaxID=2747483 RepID=A0A8X6XK71_9ARAC|nr:zinc finger BED domain-containing protein 1 [Trichonephila inaurata madagascariensis]
MSITTDNGRNILKSIEELNLENAHISCFAHNINIGVNHSLDIPILKRAIARLKKLQNAFAMSWKMKRDLHKAQELLQMEVKTLPSACPTRWWSTLKLVKRFLENQLPICKTLLEYPNKKHLMLEGNEISALEDFTTATELLEDITSSLSGEQYTTASAVLPLYMKIKNNLQNKDEDSSLLKSIKSEILESLNKYESHTMSSNLQLSTLCDPRFRLNFIESPEEVKKLAVAKMRNIYTTQKTSNPDNFENIKTRTKEQNKKGLAKFFDVFGSNSNSENTRNSSQEAEKELNEYLSMPRVSFEHDPLDWWKVHYESFPSLEVLARKYLCIQGSSVASERCKFSLVIIKNIFKLYSTFFIFECLF